MKNDDTEPSDTRSLTHMMDLESLEQTIWEPDELEAIFQHQMSAPLTIDLGHFLEHLAGHRGAANVLGRSAESVKTLAHDTTPSLETFRDLLMHPLPPIALLELTKQFAKACRHHPEGSLPGEIATVLYFLSISVAFVRYGQRITSMDDHTLRYSIDWTLKQPWLDSASKTILRECRRQLNV